MSFTGSDQFIEALVGVLTALSSAGTPGATLAQIGTSLSNYASDAGLTNQAKDLITALSSACAATSPSSHIRNSVYGA